MRGHKSEMPLWVILIGLVVASCMAGERGAEPLRFTNDVREVKTAFYPRLWREVEQQYVSAFDLPLMREVTALGLEVRSKMRFLLALCRRAELLVIDERTAGLDATGIEDVLQALVAREEQ